MWEEDDDTERHLLNTVSAMLLANGPTSGHFDMEAVLCQVAEHFVSVSARGDVSVLHMKGVAEVLSVELNAHSFKNHLGVLCLDPQEMGNDDVHMLDVLHLIDSVLPPGDACAHLHSVLQRCVVLHVGPAVGASYYATSLCGLSMMVVPLLMTYATIHSANEVGSPDDIDDLLQARGTKDSETVTTRVEPTAETPGREEPLAEEEPVPRLR